MDLIDRYIYAVSKYLPEKQQADIKKELKGLIEDMLMEKAMGAEPTQRQVEDVLAELGEPIKLAEKYQEKKRYLIGPVLYGRYISILKLLMSIVIPVVVAVNVGVSLFQPFKGIAQFVIDIIGSIVTAATGVAFWVTIGFIIAERTGGATSKELGEEPWKPSDLPPVSEKRQIAVSDVVGGSLYYAFLIAAFVFADKIIGAHISDEGMYNFIPLFNIKVLASYLPVIISLYGLSLIKELAKLYTRKWTVKLWLVNFVLSFSIVVLYGVMLWDSGLLNTTFIDLVSANTQQSGDRILEFYGYLRLNIVIIAALWRGWESVYTGVKLYRNRKRAV